MIERLGDSVDFYKIGYQLFYGGDGLALGKALLTAGKRVFFDLKLLNIDNTVEQGVAAIARTGATFLTVHAYPQCMRAAVKGAAGSGLGILGVSVLTSMDDRDVAEAGFARDTAGLVSLRAGQAKAAGVAGLVCSPREAAMVRASPKLSRRSKVIDSSKRIIIPQMGSFYRALSADVSGKHGFNVHGCIFDEVHAQTTWIEHKHCVRIGRLYLRQFG